MNSRPVYIADASIDELGDLEIRKLLSLCFTKPEDGIFKERRYFRDPYPHRWVTRDDTGALVAHLGVHEREVEVDGNTIQIGGIADVCVHPDHRGKGYMRTMLSEAHAYLKEQGFLFSVLFGESELYQKVGYKGVDNLYYGSPETGWLVAEHGMVYELNNVPWPTEKVHIRGDKF